MTGLGGGGGARARGPAARRAPDQGRSSVGSAFVVDAGAVLAPPPVLGLERGQQAVHAAR
jgi:hypothetical protein